MVDGNRSSWWYWKQIFLVVLLIVAVVIALDVGNVRTGFMAGLRDGYGQTRTP